MATVIDFDDDDDDGGDDDWFGGGSSSDGDKKPKKEPVEPGKGKVLADLPHREWILLLIRQRFLQTEKPLGDSTAILASAPTAEAITNSLLAWKPGTRDRYNNVLPDKTGKMSKAGGIKSLTGKATRKTQEDGTPDPLDRDCVEAYLDILLFSNNQHMKYAQLREAFFERKPSKTKAERKANLAKTPLDSSVSNVIAKKPINWTAIIITGIIVGALLLMWFTRG